MWENVRRNACKTAQETTKDSEHFRHLVQRRRNILVS
jgi:hypothetical protein